MFLDTRSRRKEKKKKKKRCFRQGPIPGLLFFFFFSSPSSSSSSSPAFSLDLLGTPALVGLAHVGRGLDGGDELECDVGDADEADDGAGDDAQNVIGEEDGADEDVDFFFVCCLLSAGFLVLFGARQTEETGRDRGETYRYRGR